jgi:deoxyribodipyrimidine photo-lyase
MENKAILWFRNNLRLKDNRCLDYAARQKISVLPVYVLDERLKQTSLANLPRCGENRKVWIVENLKSLQNELSQKDAELFIKTGNVVETLKEIIAKTKITTIITIYEPGYEEEQDVLRLKQEGFNVIVLNDNFLIQLENLPIKPEQVPAVFTDFRHKIEKYYSEEIFSSDLLPNFITSSTIKTDEIISVNNNLIFEAGERAALNRLNYYFFESRLVASYKETRNGLLGIDFSSHFSPWLALGVISPQTILRYLREFEQEYGANESTYWLWFELLWRDFFRYQMMKYRRLFFLKGGIRNKSVEYKNNELLFKQWINGEIAEPFVNANMLELKLSGFMSNRGRQNVASYLIHDLGIDWRWGAAYFEMQLLDYDVSSNWGNWAYIAGVGNDPRPFRKFNIKKQQEQYDPDGMFTNYWLNSN